MAIVPPLVATQDVPAPHTTPGAWPVAFLLTACFTLSYIDRQIISLLVGPIKASLSLSDTEMGLMQGVSFSLFYVIATLPLARLADRGSRPKIMASCIAIWSLMTMLCGFASQFWQMLLARIGVAAGEAGLPPSALTIMADLFNPKELARASSIFMLAPFVGGGLALLGGGALYGWLESMAMPSVPGIGQLERWQMVFILVGAPGLLLAAVVLRVTDPRQAPPAATTKSGTRELAGFILREWRVCVVYMIATSLIVMLFNAHIAWMPAAIMRSQGLNEQTIGPLFGPIYLVAGGAGTLIAGAVIGRGADDIAGRTIRFMRFATALLVPAAIGAPLLSDLWLQLACIAAAIFLTSSVISLSSLPFQFIAPSHLRAQCLALLGLVSALLGTGLGPLTVGLFSDYLFAAAAQPLSTALSMLGALATATSVALFSVTVRQHSRTRLDLHHRL